MKKFTLLIVLLTALVSCHSDDPVVDQRKASFDVTLNSVADTVLIPMPSEYYEFTGVEVDGVSFTVDISELANGHTLKLGWLKIGMLWQRLWIAATENHGTERQFSINLLSENMPVEINGKQASMPDGEWKDVIQLTPSEVVMKAEGGEYRVSTKNFWGISEIIVDGKSTYPTSEEQQLCVEKQQFSKTVDWLTVTREGNIIVLNVEPNTSDARRSFEVVVWNGNRVARLSGLQSNL